jgi:hypothetical protein
MVGEGIDLQTASLTNHEEKTIAGWGFDPSNIIGNATNGIGPPTKRNQPPFFVTIPYEQLWSVPPPRPEGIGDLQIDLFRVLLQLKDLF